MKTIELQAALREQIGKKHTKAVRKEGRVPGVVYGKSNEDATHIHLDYKDAEKILYTKETFIVKMEVEGKHMDTIIRESQFHPVKESIIHLDFMEIDEERPVVVLLPIRLVGKAVGVAKGGKLTTKLRRIKVKGIPSKLPDEIVIDVTQIDLGGTIKVKDANITNVEIVTSLSSAVASVEIPRALRSAKEAAKA